MSGYNYAFTNNSLYTLTLESQSPAQECVDENGNPTACQAVMTPGSTQYLSIPDNTGLNLGYDCNAPSIDGSSPVNYFNLNIQHQNGSFQKPSATSIPGVKQISSDNSFELSSPKPSLPAPSSYDSIPFRGVNLSGAEAGSSYQASWVPSIADAVYFLEQGMNTIRFPINWNYYTKTAASKDVVETYLDTFRFALGQLLDNGLNVILDLHDYMRFEANSTAGDGPVVSPADVGAVWARLSLDLSSLAKTYDGSNGGNQLIFEIMNEPNNMKTEQVLEATNAGLASIRGAGLSNLVLIDGNSWTGLHSWCQVTGDETDGKSNSEVMIPAPQVPPPNPKKPGGIVDTADNYAIAVHQYFDQNFSGQSANCVALSTFESGLNFQAFIDWVNKYQVKVFLSEFGSGSDQDCQQDVEHLLTLVEQNAYTAADGGFIGWTAWVAGHGWSLGTFASLTPDHGQTPQMTDIYSQYLTKPSP